MTNEEKTNINKEDTDFTFNYLLNAISDSIYRDDVDIVVNKHIENSTINGEEFHQAERVNITFEKKEEENEDEDETGKNEAEVILKVSFEINPSYGFLSVKNEANERLYSNSKRFYVVNFKKMFENIMAEKFKEEKQTEENKTFDDEIKDDEMIIIDNKNFMNFKADNYNGKIEVKKMDEANKNKEQIVVIVDRLFDFNCLPKELDVNEVDAVFEINNTNDLFAMYKATNSLTDFKTIFIQEDLEDYIIQNIRNKTK